MKIYIEAIEGRRIAWASSRIPMPATFCFETNYNESIKRLADVRKSLDDLARRVRRKKKPRDGESVRFPSYLDFSTISYCAPSAALVLAAEFDRAKSLTPMGISLVNLDTWRPELVLSLDQIGFFDLLSIQRPRTVSQKRDLSIVRFQTGSTFGNEQAGSLMKTLARMIVGADEVGALDDAKTLAARLRLYSALVEACENARRHAYPEEAGVRPEIHRWWMTGAVYPDEKRLTLVVYDQGVTIPANLPSWDGYMWIRRALRLLFRSEQIVDDDPARDALVLRLAMSTPRSSTGLPHRGKGFPAFVQVIKACNAGKLRIQSRHGEYVYEKGRRPVARWLTNPLQGTLVEWDLWL